MCFYISSVKIENYEEIKKEEFKQIRFPSSYSIAKKLKKGDKIVIYISSRISVFAAIIEVINDEFEYLSSCKKYPLKIFTKPIYILDENYYILVKAIKDSLSFIKPNTNNYGAYFQRGLRRIENDDYKKIESIINNNWINQNIDK